MNKALFVSKNCYGRAENLSAVYDVYKGIKYYLWGADAKPIEDILENALLDPVKVIVTDDFLPPIDKHGAQMIFIGHAISFGKTFGLDMPVEYLDPRQCEQIDYAICSSKEAVALTARQLGIDEERVIPMGLPRADGYFQIKTVRRFQGKNVYLYAPTFRDGYEEAPLPDIDWATVDQLLREDEVLLVKRHYFTLEPLVDVHCARILELASDAATLPYLMECDAVATDFSSIVFDAYLAGIPVVLCTDHAESYLAKRGMYLDYPRGYSSRYLDISATNEYAFVSALRRAAAEGMTSLEEDLIKMAAGACDGYSAWRVAQFASSLGKGE